MLDVDDRGPILADGAARRSEEILTALDAIDDDALPEPSELPGWSRLTIACHLRYGAVALGRMTEDALAGRPTAYYPLGRNEQRPGTLTPADGETARGVVDALWDACRTLAAVWESIDAAAWATVVREPLGNTDLGETTLGMLALARLTEVEVHGTDLGLGLADWSPTLVEVALPARVSRLMTRRTNHRTFDRDLRASWLLLARKGPAFVIEVDGETVRTRPAAGGAADFTIEGSPRDLLALSLGRPTHAELVASAEDAVGLFQRAFPGP